MSLLLVRTNVVVLARENNPSILHPSFLREQGIVSKDIKPIDKEVLSTPAVSKVVFENGLEFLVQPDRLQVTDYACSLDSLDQIRINEHAIRYINTLPHVRYRALGINATMFMEQPDPGPYVVENFVRDGTWKAAGELSSAEVKLIYDEGGRTLSVALSPGSGQVSGGAGETVGVVIEANLHAELRAASVLADAEKHLKNYHVSMSEIIDRAKTVLGIEGAE